MDKNVSATIVIVILLLALALMVVSWRRRAKRQSGMNVLIPVPADLGAELATASGLYLATTPAGDRLNRVAVGGLGFRARLTAIVTERGILLPFPGSADVFLPADALAAVGSASWTIDRGIEPAGLTVVTWTLGDTVVDSYFRFDEPAPFTAAVDRLLSANTNPATTGSDLK